MSNQVEIDVVLSGAEEAKRGLGGIGETAGAMADKFQTENEKLGEGLGNITGNVDDLMGSVGELGSVVSDLGKGGATSFMALIPAIGAVAGAGFALYETFTLISGSAEEAEKRTEAMAAAASDLESKLEALAEKGVVPTTQALDDFIRSNLKAQFSKELLQVAVEKLKDQFEDLIVAEENAVKARAGQESLAVALEGGLRGVSGLTIANEELAEATEEYNKKLAPVVALHEKLLPTLDAAAKKEQALEEGSAEATLSRVRESIALVETLRLRQAEIHLTEKQLKLQAVRITALKETALLTANKNKDDAKALNLQEEKLKDQLKEFNQLDQIDSLKKKRIAVLNAEESKSSKRSIQRVDTRRIKELALERQKQADLKTLRHLELQEMKANGANAITLLNERYKDELIATEGNLEKLLIANKRYELALNSIRAESSEAEKKRIEDEAVLKAQQREHARMFAYDSLDFDLQLMSDGIDKELALLEMRYAKERELAAKTANEKNELDRREAAERAQIIGKNNNDIIEMVGEFTGSYGLGLAEAAYQSLLFGESFTASVGQMLVALGQQAAVQSLIEAAKGTAALFMPGMQAQAAGFFKSSAMFAGAAAVAGVTGKAMGGGSSGGGGGGSPSGAPVEAPAPQREIAEQSPMVFNINFGGAVIYDTQRAAEQAMADRITTLQNTSRRGSPRRR